VTGGMPLDARGRRLRAALAAVLVKADAPELKLVHRPVMSRRSRTSMRPHCLPMAPTLVREPFNRAGWVYEEKVDGWRILAYKDGGRVRLVSRNGRDHTRRFRDLAAAFGKLSAHTLVLDGGVAICDQQLRSQFEWLREPDPDAVATPPLFMAFDLLYCDRRDITARPLRDRRARLEDVVANNDLVFPVRRLAADGLEARKQVVECGYEGYVAKDEASVYEGGPTRRWLKVKQADWTVAEDGWRRRIFEEDGDAATCS
jgi:bifunctional non-homologous end joining protein LigD